MMGRSGAGMVGVGFSRQTAESCSAKNTTLHPAENARLLSPMVQILFSRHRCVFRAKYTLYTQ